MPFPPHRRPWLALLPLLASACVAVRYDEQGVARLWPDFVDRWFATDLPGRGGVGVMHSVTCPGLALELCAGGGLTIGWLRVRSFASTGDGVPEPFDGDLLRPLVGAVAHERTLGGLHVGVVQFDVGYAREFVVARAMDDRALLSWISFRPDAPDQFEAFLGEFR